MKNLSSIRDQRTKQQGNKGTAKCCIKLHVSLIHLGSKELHISYVATYERTTSEQQGVDAKIDCRDQSILK